MNGYLAKPLSKEELYLVMKALANGKSLSPYEIIVEFYKYFWYLIGEDFLKMIQEIVKMKSLPNGMNRSLITLVFEIGDKGNFSN
jgi:hypothetical protein